MTKWSNRQNPWFARTFKPVGAVGGADSKGTPPPLGQESAPPTVLVVTTAERLRVVRDSLEQLTDAFQKNADAGIGIPHDLLLDGLAALEAIRDFARVTEETALDTQIQSAHSGPSHLRRIK
jgi:hypothetical protein